ncbi:hypothetical protein CEP54_009105 [Fusarium duplospermum]|uniref:Uncharacterized protein n=1 Tax=Fusarium duplospermum TaxID=1325734 RepID=A0A428PS96_9HYPO|nr:hypothetical protein CEP54_009105 [Fusarium duplospermum]
MAELESPKQARLSTVEKEEAWTGNRQSYQSNRPYPIPGSVSIPAIHENSRKASKAQDLMELLDAKEGRQGTSHKPKETTQEPALQDEDEDEIWKRFIFDDYSEIDRRAREEIHEQTKCDLGLKKAIPPSYVLTSASGVKNDRIPETSTTAPESSSTQCLSLNWNIHETSNSGIEPSPATKTALDLPQPPNTTVESNLGSNLNLDLDISMPELSEAYELDLSLHIPGLSDSAVELSSGPKPDLNLQTAEVSTDAIEPSSAPEEGQPGPSTTHVATEEPPELLSCTDEGMQAPLDAAAETNTADGNLTTAQPGSPQPVQPEFKFHHPSLFVGRLASNGPANMPCAPSPAPSKMGRRPRARGRREQGRPDFRTMPDYDGDPIEECCEG